MNHWHKSLASGVVVAVALSILVPTFSRVEMWPFLNYPMYSRVMRMGNFQTLRIYGIPKNPELKRFYIEEPNQTSPFLLQRLTPSLSRLLEKGRDDTAEAVHYVLDNYQRRRKAGLHEGPPLQGIALYAFEFVMDSKARNTEKPYKTILLLQLDAQGNQVRL